MGAEAEYGVYLAFSHHSAVQLLFVRSLDHHSRLLLFHRFGQQMVAPAGTRTRTTTLEVSYPTLVPQVLNLTYFSSN